MKKCKLLKTSSHVDLDYYGYDATRIIIDGMSDWEELSDEQYKILLAWVSEHSSTHILVEPVDGYIVRTAIEEQMRLEDERVREHKKKLQLEKDKQEQRDQELKLEKERRKVERDRKKFEELQKKFAQEK
jgi:hypothetical protein